MTATDASTIVLQLNSERAELEPLNRTVTHCLCLASQRELLAGTPHGQHSRRIPFTRGARRDTFFWDSWDWNVCGEADLRQFFEIAQRIGGHLHDLEDTEAANLLPGSIDEIVGRRTHLFLPDYWLFVIHHLGWTEQLPYECETHWKQGHTFADEPFCVTSRLPVNVVQASIDALTVLIDATPHRVWDRQAGGYVLRESSLSGSPHNAGTLEPPPCASRTNSRDSYRNDGGQEVSSMERTTVLEPQRPRQRRAKKRAERAANMEALKKELIEHIKAARDHAQTAVDFGREPELLPRPSRRELAERIGITESAASRCFRDPAATELKLLWETAGDLEAVMKFVRQ